MPKRTPDPVPVPGLSALSSGSPRAVRPYETHGVEFYRRGDREWIGRCPFCSKPKFYVDSETSQSDCKVCQWQTQFPEDGVTGNHYGFIRYLWRVSYNGTQIVDYLSLAAQRGVSVEGLRAWGVCKSATTGEWLVPGYGAGEPQRVTQLYRYIKQTDGKYALWVTPGFTDGDSHGIGLRVDHDRSAKRVYICEGVWDAVAFSEAMGVGPGAGVAVAAVPGCGIFNKGWVSYTAGKEVVFLYDNDHPRLNPGTNTEHQPALSGVKRAAGIVAGMSAAGGSVGSKAALSVSWLDWGQNGKGYDSALADGYDVRDWLTKDGKGVGELLKRVTRVPAGWVGAAKEKGGAAGKASESSASAGGRGVLPSECDSWKRLTDAFRVAARWTPELHGALAVSLACAASVRGVGEPLWVRLISPPSTYKSQLCKAVGTNDRWTLLDDGMNGFFSGYDIGDGKDYSLVARWFDKCLITKEGATLVTNPKSEEIIGQVRAIYDGDFDRAFKNASSRSYKGWRGTWLLAGTPVLKNFDDSELGPRFVDYVIVDSISEEMEDDIVTRAMMEQAGVGVLGGAESGDSPEYLNARKLTAGYLDYLRYGVDSNTLHLPPIDEGVFEKIKLLAKFVERMRGRPTSKDTNETSSMALPARVSKQLVKLARFVALVMQRSTVDSAVMSIVTKVAFDTSAGVSRKVADVLRNASVDGSEGLDSDVLAVKTSRDLKLLSPVLLYLTKYNVLEQYLPTDVPIPVRRAKFRLTRSFRELYDTVVKYSTEIPLV